MARTSLNVVGNCLATVRDGAVGRLLRPLAGTRLRNDAAERAAACAGAAARGRRTVRQRDGRADERIDAQRVLAVDASTAIASARELLIERDVVVALARDADRISRDYADFPVPESLVEVLGRTAAAGAEQDERTAALTAASCRAVINAGPRPARAARRRRTVSAPRRGGARTPDGNRQLARPDDTIVLEGGDQQSRAGLQITADGEPVIASGVLRERREESGATSTGDCCPREDRQAPEGERRARGRDKPDV